MTSKTGILGGAFNPPHNAHLLLADTAVKIFQPDRLIFIPTFSPPHKEIDGDWDFETRSLLIKTAAAVITPEALKSELTKTISNRQTVNKFIDKYQEYYSIKHNSKFSVSDIEKNNPGKSFTIETVKTLLSLNKNWEIFVIIGMDQAEVFDTWKDYLKLAEIAQICAADRNGTRRDAIIKRFPFIRFFDFPAIDISSTDIRRKLAAGEDISGMAPEIARDLINVIHKKPGRHEERINNHR
jgi:nicotinate-nucleotide adenylyltransferase